MSAAELLGFAIGCVLLALGAVAVVAWALRRRSADRLLGLFGVCCALYACRRLISQTAVRNAVGASLVLQYVVGIITYAINVPIGLETALRDLRRWRGLDGFDDDVTLVVARCGS